MRRHQCIVAGGASVQRCFLGARARTEKSQHGRAGFATSCLPSCVNVRGHCSSSGSYKRALCDNLQVLPDTGAQKPASHSARLVNPVAAALQRLIEANKTKLRHSWVTPQPAPQAHTNTDHHMPTCGMRLCGRTTSINFKAAPYAAHLCRLLTCVRVPATTAAINFAAVPTAPTVLRNR